MHIEIADVKRNYIDKLVEIYSAPYLYHTKKEASRYVKLFFDHHHIKLVKANGTIVGVLF